MPSILDLPQEILGLIFSDLDTPDWSLIFSLYRVIDSDPNLDPSNVMEWVHLEHHIRSGLNDFSAHKLMEVNSQWRHVIFRIMLDRSSVGCNEEEHSQNSRWLFEADAVIRSVHEQQEFEREERQREIDAATAEDERSDASF